MDVKGVTFTVCELYLSGALIKREADADQGLPSVRSIAPSLCGRGTDRNGWRTPMGGYRCTPHLAGKSANHTPHIPQASVLIRSWTEVRTHFPPSTCWGQDFKGRCRGSSPHTCLFTPRALAHASRASAQSRPSGVQCLQVTVPFPGASPRRIPFPAAEDETVSRHYVHTHPECSVRSSWDTVGWGWGVRSQTQTKHKKLLPA